MALKNLLQDDSRVLVLSTYLMVNVISDPRAGLYLSSIGSNVKRLLYSIVMHFLVIFPLRYCGFFVCMFQIGIIDMEHSPKI